MVGALQGSFFAAEAEFEIQISKFSANLANSRFFSELEFFCVFFTFIVYACFAMFCLRRFFFVCVAELFCFIHFFETWDHEHSAPRPFSYRMN